MVTIQSLYIYPVKSLAAIPLTLMDFDQYGPKNDRRYMLIDKQNQMLTQRNHPHLTLFKPVISNDKLSIHFKNNSITLPTTITNSPELSSRIWSDQIAVQEVSTEISTWFSDLLRLPVKLVTFAPSYQRTMDSQYDNSNSQVSFADGFQILLTSQSSLSSLDLGNNEDMLRFRPNIVVCGNIPFSEDFWSEISINTLKIKIVKPCSRCGMPAVNPSDGSKQAHVIKSLANSRLFNKQTYFGQNAIVEANLARPSSISINDEVNVIKACSESNIVTI